MYEYYEREKSQYSKEESYGSVYLFMHNTQVVYNIKILVLDATAAAATTTTIII